MKTRSQTNLTPNCICSYAMSILTDSLKIKLSLNAIEMSN